MINREFGQLKNEIDRIANDTEFNGKKVLNGNVSGKEITFKQGTQSGNTGANNIDFAKVFANVEGEELAKLGEGSFQINVKTKAGASGGDPEFTVELVDKSQFNGGKEYVMDSFSFTTASKSTNETFELGGVQIELDIDKTNLAADKTASFTFTNTA